MDKINSQKIPSSSKETDELPAKKEKNVELDNRTYLKNRVINVRAVVFLLLWYIFSGCTLFLNKYILTYLNGDPTVLGACQMLMTATCGFLQLYFPCGMYKPSQRLSKPPGFYRHMILVGCTRFLTVVLGLIALNYVAVSFTETIKSSAPLFTVLISRFLLDLHLFGFKKTGTFMIMIKNSDSSVYQIALTFGEHTGLYVNLSLLPVMSGLALCSINEISFEIRGFIAAMATNLTECLQNVYSKMLISGDKFKYTPAELQFYTSLASIVVQIPASLMWVDMKHSSEISLKMTVFFILNGIFFHFQSITAYVLMDYISPVTHSVANTAKRAFLIWLSVLMFGNAVTLLSGLGTIIVISGVLLYIKAQEYDNKVSSSLVQRKVRAI